MNNIKTLIEEAHTTACEKGWHDQERDFAGLLALIHSEISEALEEYRNGHGFNDIYYHQSMSMMIDSKQPRKPEGIPVELADVCIRIFDLCGHYGIDLEKAIELKMNYNKGREFRHGNKRI
jgi:NTP pyrophosphatase (non-canonical NTP hydrolase)